jgi:hypothetical protein
MLNTTLGTDPETRRGVMSDVEHKGWRIQSRPNKVPDDKGWRAHVTVTGADDTLKSKKLSDPTIYATEDMADRVGIALGKALIDSEERSGS